MKQCDKLQQAIGYIKGIERAWKIFNYVDRETDKKIPLMLWGLLSREISNTEDWIRGQE